MTIHLGVSDYILNMGDDAGDNLVEYPTVEDCLKQVVCEHHIPEIMINDHRESGQIMVMMMLRLKLMLTMLMRRNMGVTHFRLNGSLSFIRRGPMYLQLN